MKRWIVPLLLGTIVAVGGLWYARHTAAIASSNHQAAAELEVTEIIGRAVASHRTLRDTLSARFERVDDLKTAQEQALRRHRNADHLSAARTMGVARPADSAEIDRLVEAGRLVPLEDTEFYYLQDFDVSVPYVTPDLAALLDEMGRRMHAVLDDKGLPPFRFNISSVLRTSENQADLRRINPNAARGISAHEFGTTLDVVYHTYDARPDSSRLSAGSSPLDSLFALLRHDTMRGTAMLYWQELQGILGRVLIEMQEEGLVLVTLEREQPVFHITVRRRFVNP